MENRFLYSTTIVFCWIIMVLGSVGCAPKEKKSDEPDLTSTNASTKVSAAQNRFPLCGSGPNFAQLPVDLADFAYIEPLGHMAPSAHTLPTSHVYFYLNRVANPDDAQGTLPAITAVRMPVDAVVTSITATIYPTFAEFGIEFSPCEEVTGVFGHVQILSNELLAKIDGNWDKCSETNGYKSCTKDMNYKARVSELIGYAGGRNPYHALDMGIYDKRKTQAFLNPSRYNGRDLTGVCFADYFDAKTQESLSDRFGYSPRPGSKDFTRRTVAPLCGVTMQDVADTLQGNWFHETSANSDDWKKQLSLVHDNTDPTIGVVSFGGLSGRGYKTEFAPESSGVNNREFSQVKADGLVYCYDNGMNYGGSFLIQLVDSKTLYLETRDENCFGKDYAFTSPSVYFR